MSYSPDLIERFTEGDCALLAVTIHELVPDSRIALCANEYHAAVRLPDGRYLDIEGARSHREFTAQYGKRRAKLITRGWLERHGWEPDREVFQGSAAMVKRVARRLLREAGVTPHLPADSHVRYRTDPAEGGLVSRLYAEQESASRLTQRACARVGGIR